MNTKSEQQIALPDVSGTVGRNSADNYNAIEALVRRWYGPRCFIQPYAYPLTFTDLTQGVPQTQSVNNAANSDFILTDPRYQVIRDVDPTSLDPDVPAPLINVLLTDSGSQEQLMSEAVPLPTYFAHIASAAPHFMYPRVIAGRSQLTCQIQNTSGDLASPIVYPKVVLTFAGVLVRTF